MKLKYMCLKPALACALMTAIASANAAGIEEIVVTSQKRGQNLQDVPIAVSVMTGEMLEKAHITNLHDVSARLPNVIITANPLTDFINIRGVGSGQNAGFEQAVGTFVDGLYRGRSRATRAALFDVQQVEVLKGPQTTFFGNNTVAGAINIQTRKPGNEKEGYITGLYGDYGERNLEGAVTLPISDELSVRVGGRSAGSDGFIYSRNTDSYGPDLDEKLGRISVNWSPSDSFTSDLRYDRGTIDNDNYAGFELTNCPPPAPFPVGPACGMFLGFSGGNVEDSLDYNTDSNYTYLDYEFEELGWTNTWEFESTKFVSTTGYFSHDLEGRADLIPTSVPGVAGNLGAPSPIKENMDQFSQEFRLESSTDSDFDWMVGTYYSKLEGHLEANFVFSFLPFGAIVNGAFGTPTDANTQLTGFNPNNTEDVTKSVFMSGSYRPTDKLQLNYGARYTTVDKTAIRNLQFGTSNDGAHGSFLPFDAATMQSFALFLGADLGAHLNPNRTDDDFMPSVGFQYDVADNTMAYGSYTAGFKAGGFSAASDRVIFAPEYVDAYELGLKSTFLDGTLRVNTALFLSEYSDLQETTIEFIGGSPNSIVRNAAKATAQGLEVGVEWQVLDNVTLIADLGFLDSSYDSYPSGTCTLLQAFLSPGCAQDLTGKQRPYAPDYSGNFGAEIVFPLANGDLTFRPLIYITDDFFLSAAADPLLSQEGFTKVDLTVSYETANWEFSLIGKNLTDKHTVGFANETNFSPGSVNKLSDSPRTIAGQVKYRF